MYEGKGMYFTGRMPLGVGNICMMRRMISTENPSDNKRVVGEG